MLLLAVSKGRSAAELRTAHKLGLDHFGESYLQEAIEKISALADLPLCWHFIGALQANKTRLVAAHFDWAHSIDRLKIAQRLSAQRPANLPSLNVCLQVNIDNETNKAGVSPGEAQLLAKQIQALPNLNLRGLMAIPKADANQSTGHQSYAHMAELLKQLQQSPELAGSQLDTLSMGMSSDLEAAIEEGASIVRVGTALFGPRKPKTHQ